VETFLQDGRSVVIKVNKETAEFLFNAMGEETFDPTEAVEWADEFGELNYIKPTDKISIKVGG